MSNYTKKLDGSTIKWIAIVAMIIDHTAWAFVEANSLPGMLMHTVGKITGPIMFYFIVEGYHHTHDLKRYIQRLAIFSVISYFPYSLFVNFGSGLGLNFSVITTLLLALFALIIYDRVENKLLKWLAIFAIVAITYWCDWSFWGVLIALAFGIFYGDTKKQWIAYLLVNVFKVLATVVQTNFQILRIIPTIISPIIVFALLSNYSGARRGSRFEKWAFYLIYPLQFIVIGLLYIVLN